MSTQAQAVVEKTDSAVVDAAVEGKNAQVTENSDASLDSALKEFDEFVQKQTGQGDNEQPPAPEKITDDDIRQTVLHVKAVEEKMLREKTEADIAKAVEIVRGNSKHDPEVFRALLERRASQDPRIAQAFMNRERKPEAWNNVLKGLSKEIGAKLSAVPDKEETANREAITASVLSAKTTAPSAKESAEEIRSKVQNMSDAEYHEWKEANLR